MLAYWHQGDNMNKSERRRFNTFLTDLDKYYYNNDHIAWFDDLSKRIEQVIMTSFIPDDLIYEHRIKTKEKFIAKFYRSLSDHKANPDIDIFGIRLTGKFYNTKNIAIYLIEFLEKTFTPEDFKHAVIRKTVLLEDGLKVGEFHSVQFRNLSLEIQIMTPEIREYVNQTHAEYDYRKYGIIPEEEQPQIQL